MNWREYERHLLQDIKDAKHNLERAEKERKHAYIHYQNLLNAKEKFNKEIEKVMGGQ